MSQSQRESLSSIKDTFTLLTDFYFLLCYHFETNGNGLRRTEVLLPFWKPRLVGSSRIISLALLEDSDANRRTESFCTYHISEIVASCETPADQLLARLSV